MAFPNLWHLVPRNLKLAIAAPTSEIETALVNVNVPRVTFRRARQLSARRRQNPAFLVRCGCCDEQVKIGLDENQQTLEIAGVISTIEGWRNILLPVLGFDRDSRGAWRNRR